MHIEKAALSDLPAILKLQHLAYRSEARLLGIPDIPPLKQTLPEVETEYRRGIILKASGPDGRIVGSVRAWGDGDTVFVGKLIVHPDFQGNGIGTRLLTDIERVCPASRYELFTSDKSIKNLRLYERLGYVRFKTEPVSPGLSFVYLEKLMR